MKYPKVRFERGRCARVGRMVADAIQQSYPGGFSDSSDIVFRWGQDTDLPAGRVTVIFDCGYFRRERKLGDDMHFRVSINEYHPTGLPAADSTRWDALGLSLEDLYKPDGHILLVGRGKKARRKAGTIKPVWETQALEALRTAYPGREIIYRPKKMPWESLKGATTNATSRIRDLCKGCALVYTHSSNVANEAILYGVPAVAVGGPAADVCASELPGGRLSRGQRADYLHRLAYWQWSVREIRQGVMWPWLLKQIESRR